MVQMEKQLLSALRANNKLLNELSVRYEVPFQSRLPETGMSISCPEDLMNILGKEMGELSQEQLRVITLNTRNDVMEIVVVYHGNVNSSMVRPAEVLRPAVLSGVPSILITHNHPSGDPTPSGADVSITKDIYDAAKLMAIDLMDHIVIGRWPKFVSMKEAKLFGQ